MQHILHIKNIYNFQDKGIQERRRVTNMWQGYLQAQRVRDLMSITQKLDLWSSKRQVQIPAQSLARTFKPQKAQASLTRAFSENVISASVAS